MFLYCWDWALYVFVQHLLIFIVVDRPMKGRDRRCFRTAPVDIYHSMNFPVAFCFASFRTAPVDIYLFIIVCNVFFVSVFVQHLLIFILNGHKKLLNKSSFRTAPVDIYLDNKNHYHNFCHVFVQHLLIFIRPVKALSVKAESFRTAPVDIYRVSPQFFEGVVISFRTAPVDIYLTNGWLLRIVRVFSYSTCWYLSLMLLGFINYIIAINYWYCKIFIIFTSKW